MQVRLSSILIGCSKISISLLILYELWVLPKYGAIPYALQGLTIMSAIFIILYYVRRPLNIKDIIPKELRRWWFAFILYAGISGVLFSVNISSFFSTYITFASFFILCILCAVVCMISDKKWIFYAVIISDFLAAVSTILNGYTGTNQGQRYVSLSAAQNPNSLGIAMVIGILAILLIINNYKITIGWYALIALFMYTIVLCSSRKSLIVSALVVLMWLLFAQRIYLKNKKLFSIIVHYSGIVCFVIVIIYYIKNMYMSTGSYNRMKFLLDNGMSEGGRNTMYSEAFRLFLTNPVFGIGYGQYSEMSITGTYAHSTYAEALACFGIIGCIIYFVPYYITLKKFFVKIWNKAMNYEDIVYFIGLISLLVLGVGMIHFYDLICLIFMTMLFLNNRNLNINERSK